MERLIRPFDVQAFVDGQPVRAIHYRILILCALALFIDGFDVFVVGKVAPAIAAGYGATSSAMTRVFLLQQIGLAVGAFAASPLADRFGRQRMIVYCTGIYGLVSLVSPFARTLDELAALRGISGFFLSGVLPMAVALVAESAPRARRGLFISVVLAGYSAGSAAGGVVAAWCIDLWGWQSAFWIGGAIPLLLLPLLHWLLPESLQYLTNHVARPERVLAGLQRIQAGLVLPAGTRFVCGDGSEPSRKTSIAAILGSGRRITTLFMWAATFLSMGSIAMMAAWLPTFFHDMLGVPIQRFAVFAMVGFVGGLCGTLTAGWMMDRFGARRVIPAIYLCLALAVCALGFVRFGTPLFLALIIGWNFCQSGGQALLNTLLTRIYPASMRSTGMGWAGGMGRTGGVVAPLFGGLALGSHFSLLTTMGWAALLPLGVAALTWRMSATARNL